MTDKPTKLSIHVLLVVWALVALLLIMPIFMRVWWAHLSGFAWIDAWGQIRAEFQIMFEKSYGRWRFIAQHLWTAPALLIILIAPFHRLAATLFALAAATVGLLVFTYGFEYGLIRQDSGPYIACGIFTLIGLVLLPDSRNDPVSSRPPIATLAIASLFLVWCVALAHGHFKEALNVVAHAGQGFLSAWQLFQQYIVHFLPVFSAIMAFAVIPLAWVRFHWVPRYALAFAAITLIVMGWTRVEYSAVSLRPVMLPWIVLGMAMLPWANWRSNRSRGTPAKTTR